MDRLLWHPETFQGRGLYAHAFNSWYYKLVDATGRHVWAIVPGIRMDRDPDRACCFLQFIDGVTGRTVRQEFPIHQFWASRERFDIVCSHSRFSLTDLQLDIEQPALQLTGSLHFSAVQGWSPRPWSPGTLGPLALIPVPGAYHAVTGMAPRITGNLWCDGEQIDFTGGRGYMEHDWGTAFPPVRAWTQCNHFPADGAALTATITDVPAAGRLVHTFLVVFLCEGEFHTWTSWNGARLLRFRRDDHHLEFSVLRRHLLLEVWSGGRSSVGQVAVPRDGRSARMLTQELTATCQVRLTQFSQSGDRILFEERGQHASLEISGDLPAPVQEQFVPHMEGSPLP